MCKVNFIFLLIVLVLDAVPGRAQESNAVPTAEAAPTAKPWQLNAELDGYADRNGNAPASGSNALRSFDTHADAFRLAAASLDLDYKTEHLGAHVTGGYGDVFRALAATDALKGANSYLGQFYVSYRPIKDSGLQFDFGKFYTSVGAEVIDSQADSNYSRSLLFTLGEPYYHFGLRASVPVTKTLTVGAQVLNGWNNVQDNNSGKTGGFTSALTKSKWSWSQAILMGAEKDRTTQGQRQLVNEVITFTPRSTIQSYVELLYGRDKRAGAGTGADSWYGAALAGRWSMTKKFSLAPRAEYYVDQTGYTSGTPQHLHEFTGTAEYRVHPLVTTRLEYREDFSNINFFEHGHDGTRKQQGTVILAVLVSFKGER